MEAIRERLGFTPALGALVASEVVNLMTLAAEIGGVAIALQLLSGLPYRWLIVLAIVGLAVIIWVTSFQWLERIFGYGGLCLLVFAVAAGWFAGVIAQAVPGAHLDQNQIDNNVIWDVRNAEPGTPGQRGCAGSGIFINASDRLIIAQNLIGRCDNSGIFAITRPDRANSGAAQFNQCLYAATPRLVSAYWYNLVIQENRDEWRWRNESEANCGASRHTGRAGRRGALRPDRAHLHGHLGGPVSAAMEGWGVRQLRLG